MALAKPSRRSIRLLDPACVERIAAGEVVERPSSVVKELVENSLDAGARSIRVRIRRGGLDQIVVEDDGVGIVARELPLAVERHATSKIAGSGDLTGIQTYGFRGEALASISAVSRFSLRSRAEGDDVGARLDIVGGRIEKNEPYARHQGTTVEARDLFFNLPARRSFSKGENAERRSVVQAVTSIALCRPTVAFRLEADEQVVLDLPVAMDLETRAHGVFGASVAERLRRFEGEAQGLRVEGLCSLPTYTRGNRTGQFVFVNRRPVFDKAIAHAISSAYRDVIPPARFPVALLFLDVPPSRVDVNVHPAKSEVRLRDEGVVHTLVRHAIRDSLNLRHETPAAAAPEAPGPLDTPRQRIQDAEDEGHLHGPTEGYSTGPQWSRRKESPTLFDGSAMGERPGHFVPQGAPVDPGLGAPPAAMRSDGPLFWQVHNTFILTQIRGALVIVDQHNSHERILYDAAQSSLAGQRVPTQQLLFPVTMELTAAELSVYESHREDLEHIGFLTEPFGGNTVLARGIPADLRNWNEGALLRDVLSDLEGAGRTGRDPREALLASASCHGAIRAGEKLTLPEMQSLMDRLFATELPYSCPHGRPTLIRLGLPELQRRFGRR